MDGIFWGRLLLYTQQAAYTLKHTVMVKKYYVTIFSHINGKFPVWVLIRQKKTRKYLILNIIEVLQMNYVKVVPVH